MMKRYLSVVTSLMFVAGCSAWSEDGAEGAPPEHQAPSGSDEAPPLGGTPSDTELTEAFGVFVAPRGNDSGAGTRAQPFASIAKGITEAKKLKKRVYVCEGTYREAITLENEVSIVGGLQCGSEWKVGTGYAKLEAETSPVVSATSVGGTTRIEGLDIVAPDATEPGASSIGIVIRDSAGLVFARSRIAAGNGAKGADGTEGIQLTQTGNVDGAIGMKQKNYCDGRPDALCVRPVAANGAAGGVSRCSGAAGHDGESGGAGGSGGVWRFDAGAWRIEGNATLNGAKGGEARVGGAAALGKTGVSATHPGTFGDEGFIPADGTDGTDGAPGKGGQGAAGAGPISGVVTQGTLWDGNGGSGGGAGGCPGLAGTAGKGGGASIAALLVRSPIAFHDVELAARSGGAGGRGTFGSSPTRGGASPVHTILGTRGWYGSDGGSSGASGHGAGGSSFAIVNIGGRASLVGKSKTSFGTPGGSVISESARDAFGALKEIDASAAGEAAATKDL